MPGPDAAVDAHIAASMTGWLEELSRLCRVPSVSARHENIDACAHLVADLLRGRGFAATLSSVEDGHPVVLAYAPGANRARTLLFYGHYDVQPAEPLELWHSPPFEPVIRDGALYARGAKDDKGELIARLAALDALKAVYPLVRLVAETAQKVYGKPAHLVPLNWGTSPVYLFADRGVPVVSPGVGYGGNATHGPNEHVRLADFELAARHLARLVHRFGSGEA